MINLLNYIINDYIFNIVDDEQLHIFNSTVFERWEYLGFICGLDGDDAIVMSNVFQNMTDYLMGCTQNEELGKDITNELFNITGWDEEFKTCIFPMMRRIFFNYHVVLQSKEYQKLWYKYYPHIKKQFIKLELDSGVKLDIEAEATAKLCDIIGRKYRNKTHKN